MSGRVFLIYGTVMTSLLGIALGSLSAAAFIMAWPLLLPIFTVVGAMGALQVFSNDRVKGVLEYLMAYGVSPRRQFLNVLLASFVLVATVMGIGMSVGLGLYIWRGNSIPDTGVAILLVYTIPMSFASDAFATTVGMFWTAISSPRAGMSSPAGLAPFFGILPPVATLGAVAFIGVTQGAVSSTTFELITALATGAVAVMVLLLLGLADRLLKRERLLSPA